jgi:tetratricopeptide (TPR) repeat protein
MEKLVQISQQYPDSAFSLLKEQYSRASRQRDPIHMGICLQQMGELCYNFGNYPRAFDFYLQADKIFRSAGRTDLLANNLKDLGILYYYNRQISLARKQYDEALCIYNREKNGAGLADIYGRIGHLFEKQQHYDSAFLYQRLALEQYRRLERKQGMAKIYENIGSIYEDLECYDSASHYFKQSLQLYEEAGERVANIEVINNLGDILRKAGQYREAIRETSKALKLAQQTRDLYQQGSAYRDLGKAYNLLHMEDSAYYFLELSRRITIDIYSQENNRQTAFLSVLFEISKKDQEINNLENEKKLNRIVYISIALVVILLLIISRVMISRQKLKIANTHAISERDRNIYKTQKELMEKELENRLLKEVKLLQELDSKYMGLTSSTLHIIEKNQLLENLRSRLLTMVKEDKRDLKKPLLQLIQQINISFNHDEYWEEFHKNFEQVHQQFLDRIKKFCPDLNGNDMRLISLIKLNMGSADMAALLGIGQSSLRVSRYRLKKKIGLNTEESLSSFVQKI